MTQMTIQSGVTTPIDGNEVTFAQSTITNFGNTLFYEPIPFEWLYTAETSPQVMVTVDGLPAICSEYKCGYTYTPASALITGFSLSGLTLTITGTNLPTASEILYIYHSTV